MNNKKLYETCLDNIKDVNKDENIDMIYRSLLYGKNTYLMMTRRGSSSFDPRWIDVIEDCLYELGQIINRPKEEQKSEGEITPIELAKKVNAESVQHLASHTHLIKEVKESGDIVPSKILSHFNKEDLHTYENRFIATFIRRLVLFIEKRYQFIIDQINLKKDEVMMIKNHSIVNGEEVEIETKITVHKDDNDASSIDAKSFIDRISQVRDYVNFYYNSPFMKELKTDKDVRRPIIQTNIIRKNPLYKKCYETFMFIEKFDALGVSYKLEEKFMDFNDVDRSNINYINLLTYLALQDEDNYDTIKEIEKLYKPKILNSIDDEKFVYHDYLKGPIEFVRVDDKYKEFLEHKINHDLPLHPKKKEREFLEKEYKDNKETRDELSEIERLLSRKRREAEEYEKYVLELIERRDYEEAQAEKERLAKIFKEEEELLEKKRQLIIKEASKDQKEYNPKIKKKVNK